MKKYVRYAAFDDVVRVKMSENLSELLEYIKNPDKFQIRKQITGSPMWILMTEDEVKNEGIS